MRKLFAFIILAVFIVQFFNSCKKGGTTPAATTYMSFKINGVEYDMTNVTAVSGGNNGTAQHMTIIGVLQNESLLIKIDEINSGTTLVAGLVPLPTERLSLAYSASSSSSDLYYTNYANAIPPAAQVTPVNITSITSDAIEGTFAFSATNPVNTNPTVKNITEGKFKCPIIHQ